MTTPGKPASPRGGRGADATPDVVSGSDQNANEAVNADERNASAGQAAPDTPDPTGTAGRPPQSPAVTQGTTENPGAPNEERAVNQDGGEDLSARAAELEQELARVRARASTGRTVRMRVEEPHTGLTHGGVDIGPDWTEVPEHMVPAVTEAAANSGVTLTQEETEES